MASNLKRVLVLGGNGYVGQNVCARAAARGIEVRSLNRSGPPKTSPAHLAESLAQVEWVSGDIFDQTAREEAMSDVDAVISCIGAFGSNSFMSRICGDATIEAVQTAKEKKVERFGFVSSAQVYEGSVGLALPQSAPMHGYFQGKYRAEKELLAMIPKHVILRPVGAGVNFKLLSNSLTFESKPATSRDSSSARGKLVHQRSRCN